MSDLKKLQQQVIAFRDERDWKQYHSPKDMALGLLVEASELAEHFQYFSGGELRQRIKENKEDIADEVIDILWWVLLIAHDLEVDIPKEFARKARKNAKKYPATSFAMLAGKSESIDE